MLDKTICTLHSILLDWCSWTKQNHWICLAPWYFWAIKTSTVSSLCAAVGSLSAFQKRTGDISWRMAPKCNKHQQTSTSPIGDEDDWLQNRFPKCHGRPSRTRPAAEPAGVVTFREIWVSRIPVGWWLQFFIALHIRILYCSYLNWGCSQSTMGIPIDRKSLV